MKFSVMARSGTSRAGLLELAHARVETPVFMPVGTYATVKGLDPSVIESLGFRIVLSNSYHLHLSPGEDLVASAGGLQRFMGWPGAVLTDSGGYQLFSLKDVVKVTDEGVESRSPLDGTREFVTPERMVHVQVRLGVDIAMVLDHCPPSDAPKDKVAEAMDRTTRWAKRCLTVERPDQTALFGIVQGGVHLDLRRSHLDEVASVPFDGLALGGFSVGEPPDVMHELVDDLAPRLPDERPRYLMGVGTPIDLIRSVQAGMDMFDCVMPTRHARNGQLFTSRGRINVANARFRTDMDPPDPACGCPTCRRFSTAYLSHLYRRKEILYSVLATTHNLWFYRQLMTDLRQAILDDRLEETAQRLSQPWL